MSRERARFAVVKAVLILFAANTGMACSNSGSPDAGNASGASLTDAPSDGGSSTTQAAELGRSGGDATVTNSGANAFG